MSFYEVKGCRNVDNYTKEKYTIEFHNLRQMAIEVQIIII